MTGAEHYAAAEMLVDFESPVRDRDAQIARAQVHATLALAAATAMAAEGMGTIAGYGS